MIGYQSRCLRCGKLLVWNGGELGDYCACVTKGIPESDHAAALAERDETIAALRAEVEDYRECAEDVRRLTRELDVLWNGEAGAAERPMLCDVLNQMRREVPALRARLAKVEEAAKAGLDALYAGCGTAANGPCAWECEDSTADEVNDCARYGCGKAVHALRSALEVKP